MNVRGTEMPNQSARIATNVKNGIAAELFSPHNKRFIAKKTMKTNLHIYIKSVRH